MRSTIRHLLEQGRVLSRFLYGALFLTLIVAVPRQAVSATTADQNDHTVSTSPEDPTKIVGNQACVKCHASEQNVWAKTPHALTFDQLHRRPEAKQIASKLGLRSIKHDGRCAKCHYTQQTDGSGDPHAIAGVSCESCHGPAKDWLEIHHDYGGNEVTRLTESNEHRRIRLQRSIAAGMNNPVNLYLVAQSCLRCHTTPDEALVNMGGHSAGSLDFELVAWSQGSIRHNFVRSDGKTNDVSSKPRIRVMFVTGIIAQLEFGLRATGLATAKATYGVTAAKQTARAAARLKSVAAKVDEPLLNEMVDVYDGITLKLNQRQSLTEAADRIAALGFEFAQQCDGGSLDALDPYLPDSSTYK